MANAVTATSASDRLLELVGCLERQEGFAEIVESMRAGHAATLDGVWGSSCALATAALAEEAPAVLVAVCPQIEDADALVDDLSLFTRIPPERFPAWESLPSDQQIHDSVFGDRLRILKQMQGSRPPKLLVASIQSLLQPVPDREVLARQTRSLRVGGAVAIEELSRWLIENGFCNTPAVELPGEFSVRGGIVDIFAPDWDRPVRVEFFGDQIESIRRFEISSQRSLASLETIDVRGDAAAIDALRQSRAAEPVIWRVSPLSKSRNRRPVRGSTVRFPRVWNMLFPA
jgi:transcription-repair coupling factor (superfamily II helicase)